MIIPISLRGLSHSCLTAFSSVRKAAIPVLYQGLPLAQSLILNFNTASLDKFLSKNSDPDFLKLLNKLSAFLKPQCVQFFQKLAKENLPLLAHIQKNGKQIEELAEFAVLKIAVNLLKAVQEKGLPGDPYYQMVLLVIESLRFNPEEAQVNPRKALRPAIENLFKVLFPEGEKELPLNWLGRAGIEALVGIDIWKALQEALLTQAVKYYVQIDTTLVKNRDNRVLCHLSRVVMEGLREGALCELIENEWQKEKIGYLVRSSHPSLQPLFAYGEHCLYHFMQHLSTDNDYFPVTLLHIVKQFFDRHQAALQAQEEEYPHHVEEAKKLLESQSLSLFEELAAEIITHGGVEFLPASVARSCARYFLQCYRALQRVKENEEPLAKMLGRREINGSLDDEEIAAAVKRNGEIEKIVTQTKGYLRSVVKEGIAAFTQYIHDFYPAYTNLITPFGTHKLFEDHMHSVLAAVLFNVLVHQAELSQEALVLEKGECGQPRLLAHMASRLMQMAERHFSQMSLKTDFEELDRLEKQVFPGPELELCRRRIREAFVPLSLEILAEMDLFTFLPPLTGQFFKQKLEQHVLPALLMRFYRETQEYSYQKEATVQKMNDVMTKHLKMRNFIPSFCTYLAEWGVAFIPHFFKTNSTFLAEKALKILMNPPCVTRDYLGKNIFQLASDANLDFIEKNLDATLLQIFGGFLGKIDEHEFPKGKETHEFFAKIVENVLELATLHLKTIQRVMNNDGKKRVWDIRKPQMEEGFIERELLHRAMYSSNRRKYFQELTELIFRVSGFKAFSVPQEGKKYAMKRLKNELVPLLLEKVFMLMTKPSTINKLIYALLTGKTGLAMDLEKTELMGILDKIVELGEKEIVLFADSSRPKSIRWHEEKRKLFDKITELQGRLYHLQHIDERKGLIGSLNDLKEGLLVLEPKADCGPLLEKQAALFKQINHLKTQFLEYQLTPEDRNDPLNKKCGQLVKTFISLLPENALTQYAFKLKNIEKLTEEAVGKMILRQINKWTLLRAINRGVELGLPNMAGGRGNWNKEGRFIPGTWSKVSAGDAVFDDLNFTMKDDEHHQFTEDPSGKFSFFFPVKQEEIMAQEKAIELRERELHQEVHKMLTKTVDETIRVAMSTYFYSHFEALRSKMNQLVGKIHAQRADYEALQRGRVTVHLSDRLMDLCMKVYFLGTQFILEIDRLMKAIGESYSNRASLLRKSCDAVQRFFEVCLSPLSTLYFWRVNENVRQLSDSALNMLHMEINKNFAYEVVDVVFGAIDT